MAYQSEYTGTDIDKGISLALAMYPVGSIYLSVNNVNPGTIFGGTWEQIQDRFLLAAGGTYAGGTIGGAESHTHTSATHTHTSAAHTHTTAGHVLTEAEMPKHYHTDMHWGGPTGNQFGVNSTDGGGAWRFSYSAAVSQPYFCTGYAGSGASHSHGNTGSTTPGNTGSTTPGNTGSSSSLPPYLAIYVWKRTA